MDLMCYRWRQVIEKSLPAHDLIDIVAEHNLYFPKKRQFAPEFSQSAYCTMLRTQIVIGDYIAACDHTKTNF